MEKKFTEAELAIIIDQWYFSWKDRIVDKQAPHRLGFAKEDLKMKIAQWISTGQSKR